MKNEPESRRWGAPETKYYVTLKHILSNSCNLVTSERSFFGDMHYHMNRWYPKYPKEILGLHSHHSLNGQQFNVLLFQREYASAVR